MSDYKYRIKFIDKKGGYDWYSTNSWIVYMWWRMTKNIIHTTITYK